MNSINVPVMATQLNVDDHVGISFWLISAAMLAATFFFFMERDRAVGKWKTSLSVAALVTGIAGLHYFYMREVWVETGSSPTVYRYIDWLLTVPLRVGSTSSWRPSDRGRRLAPTGASVLMLVAGYLGEVNATDSGMLWGLFAVGFAAWLYIVYEIFAGEASKLNAASGSAASQKAQALRVIVTFGWAIYPIGYVYGYGGNGDIDLLNLIYNLADFVNKIAFGE